ncbi:AT-hook motif nuclear-localized protein 14 [Brassica rapa]|uniref:AT-hook motif nuclear-localized protein 14 n=1 Tax=Brassica campestris TaxID=3711 RepID=UPI000873464C|nr:AT-hook motif nuclear-localized protein 14 [Brassica rapa]
MIFPVLVYYSLFFLVKGKSGQSFVNITPGEGQYEILSLIGSYIRGEHGGKTGGLSVCLSSSDGFGGGVGGPLKAAGPVQE